MKRLHHPVSIILGLIISLASLWLAVRNIDWSRAASTIRGVNLPLLAVAVLFVGTGVLLRAERWRIIIARPASRYAVYWATTIGVFFNYTYPARAGDVIKIASLKRSTGLSFWRLGVSGVVDRLADILILLCAAVVLSKLVPSANFGEAIFFIALGGLILLLIAAFSPGGEKLLQLIQRYLVRVRRETIWKTAFKNALEGLLTFRSEMLNGSRLLALGSVSVLVAMADYFSIYYFFKTLGWSLPFVAPVVVWVFIAVGAALPSAPAAIGIHQLACVIALKIFSVAPGDAFAFSVILQTGSYMAIILMMLGLLCYRAISRRIYKNAQS